MKRLKRTLAPILSLIMIMIPLALSTPALAAPPPTVIGKNKATGQSVTLRYGHYPKGANLPPVPAPPAAGQQSLTTAFSGLTTVANGLQAQINNINNEAKAHGINHTSTTSVVYDVYSAQVLSTQLPAQATYDLSRNMQRNSQIAHVSAHLQHTLAVDQSLQQTGQAISVALYGHGNRAALAMKRLPPSYRLAVARIKNQLVPQLLADVPRTRTTRPLEAALISSTNQLASMTTVPSACTVPSGLGYNTFDTAINIDIFKIEVSSFALAQSLAKATAQAMPAELVEGAEVLGEGATTTFPDPIRIALEAVAAAFGIAGKAEDTLISGMSLGHDMVVGCYHTNLMNYSKTNYTNILALSNQNSSLQNQITGVSNQVSGVKGQIKAVAASIGNTVALIETDFSSVYHDFSTLETNLAADTKTLATNLAKGVTSILTTLKSDFTQEMTALGNLQTSVNTANAGIVTNREKLDTLTSNLAQDAKTMEGQLTSAHNLQLEEVLSKGTLIVTMALPNADGGRLNTVQQLDAAIILSAQKAGLSITRAQSYWQSGNTALGSGDYARAYLDYVKAYQSVQSKLAQTE